MALAFAVVPAHAAASVRATAYAPVKMLIQPGDHVVVKGFRGGVEYVVDPKALDVTVEVKQQISTEPMKYQDEWQFSFKRDGGDIQIFIDGPASKQAWSEILVSGQMPEYFLKITGPSLPLTVNWNEGRIQVTNVNSDLNIISLKGDVSVLRGEGDVMVSNQEGIISVRDRKGSVKIDSYLAKVDAINIEGKLDLENFTGDSRVQNINGSVNLSSYKGVTKVAGVKGRMEFKNGNSPMHIEKFEGELRGRSAQGPVFAEIKGEADVRLETAEGQVNLQLPASGAWVNLGTSEGSLAVPAFLKLTRLPTQQIRTGRLKGSNSGSVFVRTTSGDIRIR